MNKLFEFEINFSLKETVKNKSINELFNKHIYDNITNNLNSIKNNWEDYKEYDLYSLADIESICYSSYEEGNNYFIFDKTLTQQNNFKENTYKIIVLTSWDYEKSFNYVLNAIKEKFSIFELNISNNFFFKFSLIFYHFF